MGMIVQKQATVYLTTDGQGFYERSDAEETQIRVSLESMKHEGRLAVTPTQTTQVQWDAISGFIANNKDALRILLNGVMSDD